MLLFYIRTKGTELETTDQNTRKRIRELRKRHGWTQQDLADELNRLGAQTDRAAVAKVELGQRGLSLNEALQYAVALDVALVHLLVPVDSDDDIAVGPNLTCSPTEMRAWIRGLAPMYPPQNPRTYFAEVPLGELEVEGWRIAREHWEAKETSGKGH
jgi:transcriptional regulator with XRE-family HTH domain